MKLNKSKAIVACILTILLTGSTIYDLNQGYTPGHGGPILMIDDAPLFWSLVGIKLTSIVVAWLMAFGWPKVQ